MAIERDINKKKKGREPAQKALPMKPFGKKGIDKSPTYGRRNPHKDHGDKKPSLKTKASIIKDKAKKGQGLARGGSIKSLNPGPAPLIRTLLPKFKLTPKSGTISTIDSPAKKFVDIRSRVKKAGGYAMGGEAREGAARGELQKKRKTQRQQELMDMLERLYGTPKLGPVPRRKPKKFMERPILPKDKPKKKPIRPILPKDFKKPKMKRAK